METTFSYIGVYIESKTKQPWSYLKLAKIIFVAKIQQTLTKLTVLNLQYFKKDFLATMYRHNLEEKYIFAWALHNSEFIFTGLNPEAPL